MRYLNDLSYRGTNPLFYPHFPVSPKVKIQVLIIRYLQAYSQKVTKSGADSILDMPPICSACFI